MNQEVEVLSFDSPGANDVTVDELCDAFSVPRPVSFEPGQVMSWKKYRELEAQQKQK